jgi:hypothetical protein
LCGETEVALLNTLLGVGMAAALGFLAWIASSVVELKTETAVISQKVDANYDMIKPMWENFLAEKANGNLASFNQ